MNNFPRIRGRVGQIEEPIEDAGKWACELWLTEMGAGEGAKIGTWGPFDTEEEAGACLQHVTRIAADAIAEKTPGAVKGTYLDLKTNTVKRWDTEMPKRERRHE